MSGLKQFVPLEYQAKVISKAIDVMTKHNYLGLLLSPGTGKTAITLTLISILKKYTSIDKFLVVAPINVCYLVWPLEIKKWSNFSHLKYSILHGPDKNNAILKDCDIYLINTDGLEWFFKQKIINQNKWALICDESTLFKNVTAKTRFKLLKKYLHKFQKRFILTGTPTPNGLLNLWPQIYLLDEGKRLGRFITYYRTKYFDCTPKLNYNVYFPKENAMEDVCNKLKDIAIFQSNEVLGLKKLIANYIYIDLPQNVLVEYNRVMNDNIAHIGEDIVLAKNAAAKVNKLKQIANGNVYLEDSSTSSEKKYLELHKEKLLAVKNLIDILDKPALIAYEYSHDKQALIRQFKPVVLSDLKGVDAEKAVIEWNKGNIPIMIAHPASCGHGLNLQYAKADLIWYSIPYDLEFHDQTIARLHRLGSESTVVIHYIVANNTVDKHILKIINRKTMFQNNFLNLFQEN